MDLTRWAERFFANTRGQVVTLWRLCRTVDELAETLGLTDNPVRLHLAALERDGLIRQGASRRTGGKPSYTYDLIAEADRFFPRPTAFCPRRAPSRTLARSKGG